MKNAIDIALKVARALNAVGAEYFVGGSLASSLQGEPRATNDIDFVIALPLGKVGDLRTELGGDFEVDTDTLRELSLCRNCATLRHSNMPSGDPDLPSLALPAKSASTNRLLGSFLLSLLGALLLLLGLNFVLSPAFLVPAAVLVRPASTKSLAPGMRAVARLALGLALTGLIGYGAMIVTASIHSPENGLKALGVSTLSLLAPLLIWGLWAK